MKRRVLMLALFVLLGGFVNLSVAWAFSFDPPAFVYAMTSTFDCRAIYQRYCPAERVESVSTAEGMSETRKTGAVKFLVGSCWEPMSHGDRAAGCAVVEARYGWPVFALRSGVFESAGPQTHYDSIWMNKDVQLPLGVIWPGFTINTVFYAAVLWLVFAAPFALRKRLRIKRGLCPKCAYPVGTNAVCTECGAVL